MTYVRDEHLLQLMSGSDFHNRQCLIITRKGGCGAPRSSNLAKTSKLDLQDFNVSFHNTKHTTFITNTNHVMTPKRLFVLCCHSFEMHIGDDHLLIPGLQSKSLPNMFKVRSLQSLSRSCPLCLTQFRRS